MLFDKSLPKEVTWGPIKSLAEQGIHYELVEPKTTRAA